MTGPARDLVGEILPFRLLLPFWSPCHTVKICFRCFALWDHVCLLQVLVIIIWSFRWRGACEGSDAIRGTGSARRLQEPCFGPLWNTGSAGRNGPGDPCVDLISNVQKHSDRNLELG